MTKKQWESVVNADMEPTGLAPVLPQGSGITTDLPRSKCELCGKAAELRPYGPRGENICFACGMADEPTTKRQFMRTVFDEAIQ